jgi:hypothetical protein
MYLNIFYKRRGIAQDNRIVETVFFFYFLTPNMLDVVVLPLFPAAALAIALVVFVLVAVVAALLGVVVVVVGVAPVAELDARVTPLVLLQSFLSPSLQ